MIDIFVINLDRRPDRHEHIKTQLQAYQWERFSAIDGRAISLKQFRLKGFNPDMVWRDPLLKRPLTTTEVGCYISHYECWKAIVKNNRPAIIFEDDIQLLRPLDLEKYEKILEATDLLYIGYREMATAIPVSDDLVQPIYPYLLSSYCLSPAGAKKLIDTHINTNIIPVDEYVPIMIGYTHTNNPDANNNMRKHVQDYEKYPKLSALALRDPDVTQLSRKVLGSDIESGNIMSENRTHIITVATDESKAAMLLTSAARFNMEVVNLGKGVVWKGGDMKGPGGGQKVNLVRDFLATTGDNDIVLFMDGYDVLVNDDLATVVQRLHDMESDVVFAAEKTCWPDASISDQFPESHTDYKYLNSGLYVGKAGALKQLFADTIADHEDDQLYMQKQFLNKSRLDSLNITAKLDVENYIFQCVARTKDAIRIKPNRQLLNIDTRCCPCILHGNGGEEDKQRFNQLAESLGVSPDQVNFMPAGELEIIGPEVVQLDFMAPEECKKLIDKAEAYGKWESMYGDKFPGQELRIRVLDINLFDKLEQHFRDQINPRIEKHWWPLQMYGLRDAFIIKYTPETQKSLSCHHDASLVSTITYLNDDYTGGDTYFPRQNYSTESVPVGKIVMWPGQVTHGHEGREVTSGTKYALVIWTARRPGDINY